MSEFEFVPPQRTQMISFSPEPVHNIMCSLRLLNTDLSGFGHWVADTAATLSQEQLKTNRLVCDATTAYMGGAGWPTFPAWLDDIAARDPYEMRDQALASLLTMAGEKLDDMVNELPSPERLLADRAAYVSLGERVCQCKGTPSDRSRMEAEHALLHDAVARQSLIVTHLRQMWDEIMAQEWERALPMIRESVAAFESIDYSGKPTVDIVREVSVRDRLPAGWDRLALGAERIIFIPSVHIGPYLLLSAGSDTTARIVFGARIPRGATIASPALTRSELLTRLGALADDTRLSILELLAREGELRAQDVIVHLDISQSSASRHLRQLSATGYLTERRREGAKYYRLNADRLDDTLGGLKSYLSSA